MRVRLEQATSVACQEVLEITTNMDDEEKSQQLGVVTTQIKRDNEDLHDLVNTVTPPEQVTKRKSTIEGLATQLEEMDQEPK